LLISLKHFTAFGSIWFFCALSAAALADDVPWRQYENGNFVAYSNASESNVAIILESLEEFRSAAFQIPSFVIPAGRPKTLVILPATHDEFLQFAHYETVAGFSTVLAGRPTIVMPASNPNIDIRAVVGHEFAHTLLFNDYFKHPSWYAEGFAEIASSIVVDSDNDSFTIGARDDHRRKASKPAIDWNTLVDSSFDAHAQGSLDRTASAYAQDWLLVHYLTLNKSVDYASELNQYIANLNNGMPSNEAFPNAFGKTAADFWQKDMRVYLEQIENSAFFYDTTMEDLDFIVSNAVNNELQPMLKFLRDFANARHGRNAPDDPTDYLPGRWDWFKLENQCSEPMTIHVRAGTGIMVLESFYSADDSDPVPALFDIEEDDTGALVLINITSLEYPHVTITSDYQALMRSEDVMCFDAQPAARDCLRILHRCE
jgi:hypothetical protein